MTSLAKIWLIRYFLCTRDVISINLKTMHGKGEKTRNLLKKKTKLKVIQVSTYWWIIHDKRWS